MDYKKYFIKMKRMVYKYEYCECPNGLHELLNGTMHRFNYTVPQLVEKVLTRNEGKLTSTGAV